MDLLHRRSVVWFDGPAAHHKFPQTFRDVIPLTILPIRSSGILSLGDPRVNDRGVTREVRERCYFRSAFEHQHRERVGVGIRRRRNVVVLEELRG